MKTKIIIVLLATIFASRTFAQSKSEELTIKTSVICEMCETNVKKALAFEPGVKKVQVDLTTKMVTVKYNPQKVSPEQLRKAIAKAGYDADDVPADKEAYDQLANCCKKASSCEKK